MKRSFMILLLLILALPLDHGEASPVKNPSPAPSRERLIVGVTNDPPYTYKYDNGQWIGVNIDIWSNVAHTLNWQYEIKEYTLSDLLEAMRQGKVDVSIGFV